MPPLEINKKLHLQVCTKILHNVCSLLLLYPRNVVSLMPHLSYTTGYSPDIMVVKTDQPFQLTQYVKAIKLAKVGNDPKGNLAFKIFA